MLDDRPKGSRSSLQTNQKWVRLGCSLLNTLMSTAEGVRYLSNEDQFLTQIVKAFAQLDPVSDSFRVSYFC